MTIKFRERDITHTLLDALANMPVVVITGMRQVGKSTLLQFQPQLKGRHYITLDDFAQLEAARHNPEAFIQNKESLTVDEVQKCPQLLTVIKREVERDRRPGRFLLSGSANFGLLKDISESLAGRAVYLTLNPFTRREISGDIKKEPFLVQFFKSSILPGRIKASPINSMDILQGGMPSVCLKDVKNPIFWFKGYEQTYLERDIREFSQVTDLVTFRHLLRLTALRTGQLLKISELARDARMNSVTAGRYLNLMEASFVIYRVGPYLANRSSRLIKSPKIFMSDSGIACYLADISKLDLSSDQLFRGSMLETYVAQNLSGIISSRWPQARVSFWNIQGRQELDFIIEVGRNTIAIEVKAASQWSGHDLKGLRTFLSRVPRCIAGIFAYNGTDAVQLEDRLWAIPIDILLS